MLLPIYQHCFYCRLRTQEAKWVLPYDFAPTLLWPMMIKVALSVWAMIVHQLLINYCKCQVMQRNPKTIIAGIMRPETSPHQRRTVLLQTLCRTADGRMRSMIYSLMHWENMAKIGTKCIDMLGRELVHKPDHMHKNISINWSSISSLVKKDSRRRLLNISHLLAMV